MFKIYDAKSNVEIKRISIISMFKNNEKYLTDFFIGMMNEFESYYDIKFDYYIIENNSKDDTRKILKSFMETKSEKSKLLLFNKHTDYKNIGTGKNHDRLVNLTNIRNKLVNSITPLDSEWSLFIDSNIYFKVEILKDMFSIIPKENNIGMIIPYTQQLFIPNVHKLNLTKPTLLNHFYDTFSFYDNNSKTFWPYCAFEKCKLCKRETCKDRKSIPTSESIVDVDSGFAGFALIETNIINNKDIRWKTLSHEVKDDESICEHYLFCHSLKLITKKRIVLLQNVDEIYRTY
tara:strand:+ start:15 stop:884 length:870 start_codon:yes stop_codon:yes gene_type:complete